MATIINNTDTTLSVEAQQTIRNAAANYGTDRVEVKRKASYDDGEIFDVYDAQDFDATEDFICTVSNPDGVLSN